MVIEAAYVGSNSVKLPVGHDVNQPLPGVGALAPRRRFPALGTITRFEPMGRSNFHSLQVKAERRYSNGMSVLTSYTFGKALELFQQRAAAPATGRAQNNLDLSLERGRTANDVRQRLAISYIYDLTPAGSLRLGNSRLVRSVLGDWQVSGQLALQSGLPFTVAVGYDPSNTGLAGFDARPNRVGRGDLPKSERTVDRWFNPADFVVQPLIVLAIPGATSWTAPASSISTSASTNESGSPTNSGSSFAPRFSIC